MTRLSDLHPVLVGSIEDGGKGRIMFDCPKHRGTGCRLAFFVGRTAVKGRFPVWAAIGEFPETLSLSSSLDFSKRTRDGSPDGDPCWHGGIVNGEIT